MSDEEDRPEAPPREGDLVLYDFFKHVTSLVLLTLGGLLLVIKDFDPEDVKPGFVVAAIILISSAGILSFGGAGDIARARYTGKPTGRSLELARLAAPALLAVGLGLFLAMFIDSLN